MKPELHRLPNLGPTIRARLHEIGVNTAAELKRLGAARAYNQLCKTAGKKLPRCYYLYSLEAALRGVHWTSLSSRDKQRLVDETRG